MLPLSHPFYGQIGMVQEDRIRGWYPSCSFSMQDVTFQTYGFEFPFTIFEDNILVSLILNSSQMYLPFR